MDPLDELDLILAAHLAEPGPTAEDRWEEWLDSPDDVPPVWYDGALVGYRLGLEHGRQLAQVPAALPARPRVRRG